jgi:predicted NAD-dependent protein-ADP-ribosyltransferase YbiA (DUF1768 family)
LHLFELVFVILYFLIILFGGAMSWKIDPHHVSPGRWAYTEFEAWAKDAEKQKHFKLGQAERIVTVFDEALHVHRARQRIDTLGASLDGLVRSREISPGNKSHIMAKAQAIFRYYDGLHQTQGGRGSAPAAAAPQSGQRIDIAGIQRVADQHGFVWFYKAPENTLTQCFGNYFESGTRVLGCATSEGAFLAQKYGYNLAARHPFTDLTGDALHKENMNHKSLGRQVRGWAEGGNTAAMKAVLADKFAPGTPLAAALLATGRAHLVEHNPVKGRDAIWSDDHDGSGRNMLGQLLMEWRGVLGGTGVVPPPANYLKNPSSLR